MPSRVWGRDPQEAFEEPYEYEVQEQFSREAGALLSNFYKLLNSERFKYLVEDKSPEKAVWLLAMDALDSLRECLIALGRKEHRIAGKQFRDIIESMDLAAYFHSGTSKSASSLQKWFDDEIVPHREYRDFVKQKQNAEASKHIAEYYKHLSRFTHRSYHAILAGYIRGKGGRLVHDRTSEIYGNAETSTVFLVLPQTISSYYAVLANLVLEYSSELSELVLLSQEEIQENFDMSLESETVPKKFLPRRWLMERLQHPLLENSHDE